MVNEALAPEIAGGLHALDPQLCVGVALGGVHGGADRPHVAGLAVLGEQGEPGRADREVVGGEGVEAGFADPRLEVGVFTERAQGRAGDAELATAEGLLIEGDIEGAKNFARRAQGRFGVGSPGWLKADDIINYESPEGMN